MGDGQAQELERRWRATGTDRDHAALLRELQRTGVIDERLLEVASILGHPAAGQVAWSPPGARGWTAPAADPTPSLRSVAGMVEELGRRDARLAFEAVTYAVSLALEQLPDGRDFADEADRRRLADALFEHHDFLRRPAARRGALVLELLNGRPAWGRGSMPTELWNAARRLAEASNRAHADGGFAWSPEAEVACGVALRLLEQTGADLQRLRFDLARAMRKVADRILPTTP